MLSGKRLFIYWLISVVISVGLPVSVAATVRSMDPAADPLVSLLFDRRQPPRVEPAPTGGTSQPSQTGAGVAVPSQPPATPAQPSSPPASTPSQPSAPPAKPSLSPATSDAAVPPRSTTLAARNDPLSENDASRPVSLKGHGGFLDVITNGQPIVMSDGRSIVPIVAQRWDIRTTDKVIALTFDDGPNASYTSQILDVLKKYDARATFFVVGDIAQSQPDLLKRMVAEGHEIGNHGYSHKTGHSTTVPEYIEEMEKTREIIKTACGATTRWYRPNNMHMSATMFIACQKTDHNVSVWSIDTRDWSSGSAETIVRAVDPQHIAPGSVVLFHDGGGNRERTVKAVDMVLAALKAREFTSVTMSELIERAK